MKKLIALFFLLASAAFAQEPRYGGIVSNHPVTTKQVLGLELTWLGMRAASGNTLIAVNYQVNCDNGNGFFGAIPSYSSFVANDSFTASAAFNFSGTGQFFPCNGWLVAASALIISPNTITPGELMVQLQIMPQFPIGWNIAVPSTSTTVSTATTTSILSGIIGDVLYNCSMVSGYTVSWPSSSGCSGNPRALDPGTVQNVNVANPAAGANWTCGNATNAGCTVLAGQNQIQIINVTYTLTTSATAGNRFACLYFRTGGVAGTVVGTWCSPYAQQPSTTVTYSFSVGVGGATNCATIGSAQAAVKCPFVPVALPAIWEANGNIDNFAITSFVSSEVSATTSGLDATDAITNINIRARVWHGND